MYKSTDTSSDMCSIDNFLKCIQFFRFKYLVFIWKMYTHVNIVFKHSIEIHSYILCVQRYSAIDNNQTIQQKQQQQ